MLGDPHSDLPALRQFARAALCDQLVGDEVVRLAMAGAQHVVVPAARCDLFRAFVEGWRLATSGEGGDPFSDANLASALPGPARTRNALVLLVDIIGFTVAEASDILGIGPEAVGLLDRQREQICATRDADILLIDAIPPHADDLASTLRGFGYGRVQQELNVVAAIDASRQAPPDLIIADCSLAAQGAGAPAVAALCEAASCPVVFVTACPGDVLAGEAGEPDFVLPKPLSRQALRMAVAHALDLRGTPVNKRA